MDKKLKEALIVFGGGFALFWILKPVFFKTDASSQGYTPITAQQKEDAKTSIVAYKSAVQAGEPSSNLAELNQLIHQQTGLRVNMKTDGTYFAVTNEGQSINV